MQFELCHLKTIACCTHCALKMEVPKPGLNFGASPLEIFSLSFTGGITLAQLSPLWQQTQPACICHKQGMALSHQNLKMPLGTIRPHGAFPKLHCRRGAEPPCFKLLHYQKTSRVSQAFITPHNLCGWVRVPCSRIGFYPAPGTLITLPNQSLISARWKHCLWYFCWSYF